jgi:hypothetical protein
MTYGCGAWDCKTCYPYVYRCECGADYPQPVLNGEPLPECQECGLTDEDLRGH